MEFEKPMGRLIFNIFLFLSLLSCDKKVEETLIDYVIFNESGRSVTIIPNEDANFPKTLGPITILNNEGFSERIIRNERFDRDTTFATYFGTDSITILFQNQRQITYSCLGNNNENNCLESRNILKVEPNLENRAEYTFTTADFETAVPCDGPCN